MTIIHYILRGIHNQPYASYQYKVQIFLLCSQHSGYLAYTLPGGFSSGLIDDAWLPFNTLGAWAYSAYPAMPLFLGRRTARVCIHQEELLFDLSVGAAAEKTTIFMHDGWQKDMADAWNPLYDSSKGLWKSRAGRGNG